MPPRPRRLDGGVDAGSIALLVVAGVVAGAINGVVGAGTLITYPALLAVGAMPVAANATNTTGLSVGSWSSAYAYRRELTGRRSLLLPALLLGIVGAAIGASLVLVLPERVFAGIVPWLIVSSVVLVVAQPFLAKRLANRTVQARRGPLTAAIGAIGIYGGYFGAGQGVVLMAALGTLYDANPQHANAAKNLMAAGANITAAVVFMIAGRVWWAAALCIAAGALVGGTLGAKGARMLPAWGLRAAVVAVGIIAAVVSWRVM